MPTSAETVRSGTMDNRWRRKGSFGNADDEGGIGSHDGIHTMIRCREIGIADLDAVADPLTRGFACGWRDYTAASAWCARGRPRLSLRPAADAHPSDRAAGVTEALSLTYRKVSDEVHHVSVPSSTRTAGFKVRE